MEPLDLGAIKKESEPWVNDRIEGPRAREALALITIIKALVVAGGKVVNRAGDMIEPLDPAMLEYILGLQTALALVRREP